MPDNAIKTEAVRASRRAKALGLSQLAIAKATGYSQSQVSRALAGHTLRRSKAFKDICSYVFFTSNSQTRDSVIANRDLVDALTEVWDGTESHSTALACVIRSLGTLRLSAAK